MNACKPPLVSVGMPGLRGNYCPSRLVIRLAQTWENTAGTAEDGRHARPEDGGQAILKRRETLKTSNIEIQTTLKTSNIEIQATLKTSKVEIQATLKTSNIEMQTTLKTSNIDIHATLKTN